MAGQGGNKITQLALVFEYLHVLYQHELFSTVFLGGRHRIVCFEELFAAPLTRPMSIHGSDQAVPELQRCRHNFCDWLEKDGFK